LDEATKITAFVSHVRQVIVTGPGLSPVDFPQHNIERAEDRRDVGQHVPTAQEIHRLEVRERRRANLSFVRPVGAVGHQIDPELTLGRLDGGIYFASRNPAVSDPSAHAATYAETGATNPRFKKLYESLAVFRSESYLWWQVAEMAFDSFQVRMRSRT